MTDSATIGRAEIKLIGFTGLAGSGKSTTARKLADLISREIPVNRPDDLIDEHMRKHCYDHTSSRPGEIVIVLPFAYALREEVATYLATSRLTHSQIWREIWDTDAKKRWRQTLQFWGTEIRRELFGTDYWIVKLEDRLQRYALLYPHTRIIVIVDDVRFPNEADWLITRYQGMLFRTLPDPTNIHDASMSTGILRHASEAGQMQIRSAIELPWGPITGRIEQVHFELTRRGVIRA